MQPGLSHYDGIIYLKNGSINVPPIELDRRLITKPQ